ncbi:hypothetical protein H1R20_g2292, partial [Candolleomyces eurysporus]
MVSRGQSQANGHSARHPSISSIQAQDTGNSQRGGSGNPAVESAVTRLLVSIKALLESLTQWSQQRVDENYVSDVYVRLGNDFNAAVAAFAAFNIDMAELVSVPEDLRAILEQCLAEEATGENLEIYLPEVRQIITNLLQGLRAKQSIYRRIASEHRRTQSSRTIPEEEKQEAVGGSMSRRSAQSSTRSRREVTSQTAAVIQADEPFIGGFAPTIVEHVTGPENHTVSPRRSQPQLVQQTAPGRSSPAPPTLPELSLTDPTSLTTTTLNNEPPPPMAPPVQQAPANAKRYSLVDKPATSPPLPTVSIEPSSPDPTINGIASPSTESIALEPSPAVANSLAALKKNDVLERRASKRFSTYNISKMTGAPTRERSMRNHPHRRSLASNAAPTATELAVLTEEGDEEEEDVPLRSRVQSRAASPEPRAETSAAGRRPITPARPPDLPVPPAMNAFPTQDATPSRITVFLQLGREVKKVGIELPLSFATLRVLFVDKFSYNPGQDNFPAIYIRDPSSGVQYELEDVEEVKDKCLLSLNIEVLDQIKQHIDSQMSALSQDIKDLKTAVSHSNKQTAFQPPPPMFADMTLQPLAESTPARPSDRQLQSVARRISKFVGKDSSFAAALQQQDSPPPTYVVPQITGQSLMPQVTGASVMSEYSNRVVQDLKIQFDEVQNLRRDLAVLRQTYLDFMKKTKEALGTLRTQTQSVRQLATTSVGGARAYIDSGKKKLDARSQDILTEVEKLQDTVERVKDDVIKRNTTPKPQYFKNIKKDIDAAAAELESLKEHIKTVKPMWKKTWEEELQNIVEEQQFLTHQEEFLSDLLEDHKAVLEIYGHVEKIVNLRGPSANGPGRRGRGPTFRPPPPEEGHNGLSTVMLEIRGAAVDPEKRLKAIEESQRNRELERNARSDEMQVELSEFVGQKKLRMTGGAEEVDRLRQKRDEMTLKAMFSPANSTLSLHTQDTGNFEYPSSPS